MKVLCIVNFFCLGVKWVTCGRLRVHFAALPDERERVILSLRYGLSGEKPLTQKETAERLGISRSYVSRLEKKALERLKKQLQKEDFFD